MVSSSTRIIINAGLFAALLAMQPYTYSLGFSRLFAFYAGVGAVLVGVNRDGSEAFAPGLRGFGTMLASFAAAFAVMHVLRETLDTIAFGRELRDGIRLALIEITTAAALVIFVRAYRRRGGVAQFLATVALGITA